MLNNTRNFFNYHRFKEFTNSDSSLSNIDALIVRYLESQIDFSGYNKKYGGNIIKLDRDTKDEMIELLKIKDCNISNCITRLQKAGIIYKVRNGVYQYNPYLAAKGADEDIEWLRRYGVFRDNNIGVHGETDVFKNKDELIFIWTTDYEDEIKHTQELIDGKRKPMRATEILDVWVSLKIITKDEALLIIKKKHPLQNKKNPFEKLDMLLAAEINSKEDK